MKAILLFALLYLSIYPLLAQKNATEYWYNGMLKKSLVVKGNDTLKLEYFQENGLPAFKAWRKDSAYQYDLFGTLRARHYDFEYNQWTVEGKNKAVFNPKGELIEESYYDSLKGNNHFFYENEALKLSSHSIKLSDSTTYSWTKNAKNQLTQSGVHTFVANTKRESFDTFYFPNNKIHVISKVNQNKYPFEIIYLKINDETGHTLFESTDEQTLKLEKDNSECLYGFKNQKGDWTIPPQYEEVEALNLDLFIAYKPDEAALLNHKGQKLFTKNWTFLGQMQSNSCGVRRNPRNYYDGDYWLNEVTQLYQTKKVRLQNTLLKFRQKGKYGVSDMQGNVLLEPFYDNVRNYSIDAYEVQIGQKWGVVNGKGTILVEPQFYKVTFTDLPNIFAVSDTFSEQGKWQHEKLGLIDDKGNILLPIEFGSIQQVDSLSFLTTDSRTGYKQHIFNVEKGHVFNDSVMISYSQSDLNTILATKKDAQFAKKGVANVKGEWIFPLEFKEVELAYLTPKFEKSYESGVLLKNQKNKWGLYHLQKNKPILPFEYDNILCHTFSHEENQSLKMVNDIHQFETFILAKKNNKWQLLNSQGKPLKNGTFDNAGLYEYQKAPDHFAAVTWLVSNDSVGFYTTGSFPLKADFRQILKLEHQNFFQLKDFDGNHLLFDKRGKILLPPQYLIKNIAQNYVVAFDTIVKKYVSVDTLGKITPFNFGFAIKALHNDLVVVEDPKSHQLGVIDLNGKTVIPNSMEAISISDTNKLLWLKINLPKLAIDKVVFYNDFESCALDEDWMMYDLKGKPLNSFKFSMPIVFKDKIGIGKITATKKYGIWQNDGRNILPPQYDYILKDTSEGVFYIFKRWADSTLAVGYCNLQGKVIKEPRFDKMSRFFGDFALVQTNAHRGILRKNGEWLCPPFEGSILNFKGNLVDSLHKVNLKYDLKKNASQKYFYQDYTSSKIPFALSLLNINSWDFEKKIKNIPDSIQKVLFNFILYKGISCYQLNAFTDFNLRVSDSIYKTSEFTNIVYTKDNVNFRDRMVYIQFGNDNYFKRYESYYSNFKIEDINKEGKYGGLIATENEGLNDKSRVESKWTAHNFYQNDIGKWVETSLEDWLIINRENTISLNNLLLQKVKLLENENLDCSNSSSFFETTKNLYYIQKEGIVFFIPRTNNKFGQERQKYEWHHAPVLLTWGDLKGISKKQP
jgi:WG containing repeat